MKFKKTYAKKFGISYQNILEALPFIMAVIASRLIASIIFPQFDDSFIILHYAKNLATGFGFIFNRGEWILGVSCPLFGFLETTLFLCRLPMPQSILALNILFDITVMLLSFSIIRKFVGRSTAIIFAAMFSLNPTLSRISIGCSELDLFMLTTLLTVWLFFHNKTIAATLLGALSFFLRPEVVILLVLLLSITWKTSSFKHAATLAGLCILVIGFGLFLISHYYGGFIPQSVLTKLNWSVGSTLVPIRGLFLRDPISTAFLPLAIGGIFAIRKSSPILQTILTFAGILTAVYCIKHINVPTWYAELPEFGITLLASLALGSIIERSALAFKALLHRSIQVSLSVAVIVLWSTAYWYLGPSLVTQNVYGRIKRWGSEMDFHSKSIMANDIGAVGFYTDARILDLDGLISYHRILSIQDKLSLIRKEKPDFLFLDNVKDSYDLMLEPLVNMNYTMSSMILQKPSDSLSGTQTNAWNQNYIVLKRKEK